jgi:hypothetical protein
MPFNAGGMEPITPPSKAAPVRFIADSP